MYVQRLSEALADRGVEVGVFSAVDCAGRRPYEAALVEGRVPVYSVAHRLGSHGQGLGQVLLDSSRFYLDPAVDAACAVVVETFRPDVIHIHHLVHLSGSLIGMLKRMGLPVVVTLHDYWYLCITGQLLNDGGAHFPDRCGAPCIAYVLHNRYKATGWLRWGLRRAIGLAPLAFEGLHRRRRDRLLAELNSADRVLAPSRFIAEVYCAAGLSASLVSHSPYGVPSSSIPRRDETRTAGAGLRVGFLGRIVPEKGLHVLLEAFDRLDDSFELHVHGVESRSSGYASRLSGRMKSSRVQRHGPYDHECVGEVLSGLDVLVVPSVWWENAPLVILEAFAAGVPVVASNLGGMRELVRHGENGLLFEVGDSDALAEALLRLRHEPGLLACLRRDPVLTRSLAENADELEGLYCSLVAERSPVEGRATGAPRLGLREKGTRFGPAGIRQP